MSSDKNSSIRIVIGIILIFMGVAALLDNFDFLDLYIPYEIYDFIFSWETVFIIIGLVMFYTNRKSAGIIFVAVGLFGYFPEFWPLVLVFIGVYILYRKDLESKNSDDFTENDFIDDVAIFGGSKKIISSQNFGGGKTTAVFGGSEYDLRDAALAEGNNVIDVFAIFGGSTFLISEKWNVNIDIIPIFGGFKDKRKTSPDIEKMNDRSLTIKGLVIFGGGEIRN